MQTSQRFVDTKKKLTSPLGVCFLAAATLASYAALTLPSGTRITNQLIRKFPSALTRQDHSPTQLPQLQVKAQLPRSGVESSPDLKQVPTKLIVAWTSYFSQPLEGVFTDEHLEKCTGTRACRITSNKSLVRDASAVIFHVRDVNFRRLPPTRSPGQYWILFNLESPVNARITSAYDNVFNLTMTYRNDSDLPMPYGYFGRRVKDGDEPAPLLAGRKSAYWLVSNCAGSRMAYARRLMQHVDVDVFGSCSGSAAPRLREDEAYLRSRYAFYLAFENSQCPQYITEKLWETLSLPGGAIPVAFGAPLSDYEALAPPNSFVHVDNFSSPSELGKFIKKVGSSDSLFSYYHDWRRKYTAYGRADRFRRAACALCDKLHAAGASDSGTAEQLSKWFNTGCRT